MSAQGDFATYCAELLAAAGAVRFRRMFGGGEAMDSPALTKPPGCCAPGRRRRGLARARGRVRPAESSACEVFAAPSCP